MAKFHVAEWISASPEHTFEFMSDLRNVPKWVPGVIRVDHISGKRISKGTRFFETRVFRGRESGTEMEVVVYEPPFRYSTAFTEGGYSAQFDYTLTNEGEITRVRLVCIVNGHGIRKIMEPLVALAMKRRDKYQLTRLKMAIESLG